MKIENAHIVITGAGTGVGAAIAKQLAAQGARLTLLGRRLEPVVTVANGLPQAQALSADVTDPDSLAKAISAAREPFGPVQMVIANAGAVESKAFGKLTSEDWQTCMDVNLTGVFNTFHACVGDLLEAKQGHMLAVASTAGLRGYPYVSAYVAAKHGVIGLVKALAQELANKHICVNAVCPGYTRTPLLEGSIQRIADSTGCSLTEAEAILVADNPQGRLLEPDEVAATVSHLLSQRAINGQAVTINGGEF